MPLLTLIDSSTQYVKNLVSPLDLPSSVTISFFGSVVVDHPAGQDLLFQGAVCLVACFVTTLNPIFS
jgi:hypothetical protein